MIYSTQELISILDEELRATWKGKRIVLSSADRINDPVVAKALDLQKISKVFAYQDFRRQIHQYQHQHRVSGIVWREANFNGKTLRFPELHNQLVAIPGDKETLIASKTSVLEFWWEVTQMMNFWLASDRSHSIPPARVKQLAQEAEWAEIDATRTEVYLGLCWGNPQEYQYQWAYPHSGCHRIIASMTEPSSIKV
jgi:hypothetical protein